MNSITIFLIISVLLNMFLIYQIDYVRETSSGWRENSEAWRENALGWEKLYFERMSDLIRNIFEAFGIDSSYVLTIKDKEVILKIGEIDNQIEMSVNDFFKDIPESIDLIKSKIC